MYNFSYSGGSRKSEANISEKFLLFAVVNGRETPFYSLRKNEIVTKIDEKQYQCPYQTWKLFVHRSGFGVQTQYRSFYLKLLSDDKHITKISPFSINPDWWFRGYFKLLTRTEVLSILNPQEDSYRFIQQQEINTKWDDVLIFHEPKPGIRKVRM